MIVSIRRFLRELIIRQLKDCFPLNHEFGFVEKQKAAILLLF
jgi:hypothetical protein